VAVAEVALAVEFASPEGGMAKHFPAPIHIQQHSAECRSTK
jgi:hypothetical protein